MGNSLFQTEGWGCLWLLMTCCKEARFLLFAGFMKFFCFRICVIIRRPPINADTNHYCWTLKTSIQGWKESLRIEWGGEKNCETQVSQTGAPCLMRCWNICRMVIFFMHPYIFTGEITLKTIGGGVDFGQGAILTTVHLKRSVRDNEGGKGKRWLHVFFVTVG